MSAPITYKGFEYAPWIDFTPEQFRAHASSAYNLTAGLKIGLTDKQEAEMKLLYETEAGLALGKNGKPLKWTDRKRERLAELTKLRDAKPTLSKSAMTVCEDWIIAMLYDQYRDYETKYTKKGNENELLGVEMTAEYMKRPFMMPYKGERFTDADLSGLPDVIEPDIGVDVKNPYWAFSHPVLKSEMANKLYQDQGVVYCELCDRDWWCFSYTLTDAPDSIIEWEARQEAKKEGLVIPTEEIYDRVTARLTYSNQPIEKRIRLFWVKRDNARVKLIRAAVKLCREYIHTKLVELSQQQSITPPEAA